MKKNAEQIAIYTRKSKFTGKGESIDNQIELCREHIRSHFGEEYADSAEIYEDEGFSGGNLERPSFKRMMDAVRKHQYQAIVVYRLDRISRNISDFSHLVEELGQLNVDFISIKEQFDTSNPMGRAMMYISSVFSQLERETIAERIRDNMHELAKTGRWLGGITPTGYVSEPVQSFNQDGRAKKHFRLAIVPSEAETVKLIFQLYLELDSISMLDAELLRRHVVSKNGVPLTRYSIRAILQNPVYAIADDKVYAFLQEHNAAVFSDTEAFDGQHGLMVYNRTEQHKGRSVIFNSVSEWIVCVGEHPGLIPGADWVKVQQRLFKNKDKSYRSPRTHTALLVGLLNCTCGNRIYPKVSKRTTAEGERVYTYMCKLKERSKRSRCNMPNINGNALDEELIRQLQALNSDASMIERLEKLKNTCISDASLPEQHRQSLEAERTNLERKINSLIDSLTAVDSSAARARIAARIEELNAESERLKANIEETETQSNHALLTEMEFDRFRNLLGSFGSSFADMNRAQQREAVRALVSKAVWDGQNVHVILFGHPEDTLNTPSGEMFSNNDDSTFFLNDEQTSISKVLLCADSKRDPHVPAQAAARGADGQPAGAAGERRQ